MDIKSRNRVALEKLEEADEKHRNRMAQTDSILRIAGAVLLFIAGVLVVVITVFK